MDGDTGTRATARDAVTGDAVTGDGGRPSAVPVPRRAAGPVGVLPEPATWAFGDPWADRMDRLRRVVPLPLLVVSTVAAFVFPPSVMQPALLVPLGAPLVAAAAVLWTIRIVRPVRMHRDESGWGWQLHFAAHTVIAGLLVWIGSGFGVFAYAGFLYAYGLGRRVRMLGFAATALVVAASMTDGYPLDPLGDPAHLVGYVVVAAILMALVLNSASITVRAVVQSHERGQMITELAEANRKLAASTAENAGLQARLLSQAREAGVAAERQRLAGEIHDTLAQDLAGIVRQLDAAEEQRDRTGEWVRHVGNARTLARSALTEARRSVRALSPTALERDGLATAIRALAESTGRLAGLDVTADVGEIPAELPSAVGANLFRVAQEALANVVRHAGATRARITLTVAGDTVLLDVVDDGDGFDPGERTDGFGVAGMRERMAGVGGSLTVDAAPGRGTSVNASVTLR